MKTTNWFKNYFLFFLLVIMMSKRIIRVLIM